MTSRERMIAALNGSVPDRVPVALGFSDVAPEQVLPAGWPVADAVDIRFVSLAPSRSLEQLRRAALPFRPDTRLGTAVQASTYARWRYRPERRTGQNPLARARSIRDLHALRFPVCATSPRGLRKVAKRVAALHARGLAVGGTLPHLGGELFESAWRLRGLENFLLDLEERPAWADVLLDRLAEFAVGNARVLVQAGIDVLSLGDDVGMPGTMMISPATWRRFFRPRLAQIVRAARSLNPAVSVLYHSDGHFEPILDDLVEIGVNAINPLQPEHMDAVAIRRRLGRRLALWGTVGAQTTFARAKPGAIRREVLRRIETLGRTALVLSPAYDIDTPEVSQGNVAEFVTAARELG